MFINRKPVFRFFLACMLSHACTAVDCAEQPTWNPLQDAMTLLKSNEQRKNGHVLMSVQIDLFHSATDGGAPIAFLGASKAASYFVRGKYACYSFVFENDKSFSVELVSSLLISRFKCDTKDGVEYSTSSEISEIGVLLDGIFAERIISDRLDFQKTIDEYRDALPIQKRAASLSTIRNMLSPKILRAMNVYGVVLNKCVIADCSYNRTLYFYWGDDDNESFVAIKIIDSM